MDGWGIGLNRLQIFFQGMEFSMPFFMQLILPILNSIRIYFRRCFPPSIFVKEQITFNHEIEIIIRGILHVAKY